jgi:aminoglycoside 6'-N-acetyltransferase
MEFVRLTTPRLLIRELEGADWEWLYAYESDPENARYQSYPPRTPENAREVVRVAQEDARARPRHVYELGVVLIATGMAVGRVGGMTFDEGRQATLWFSFGRAHWGQGYALEATRAFVTTLFARGLHRVQADCDPRNEASARLLRRLGMRQEGHRIAAYWDGHAWCDSLEFALLAEEFRSR